MDNTIAKLDGPKTARYPPYDELRGRQSIAADTDDEPSADALSGSTAGLAYPPPAAQADNNVRQSSPSEETTTAVVKAGVTVHIPVPPDVLLAHKIGDIKRAFDAEPSKATAAQFEHMLDYAVRSNDPLNREEAWDGLTHMINVRPDIVDASLLRAAVENSRTDLDSTTRVAIQKTLGAIAEKRPVLADASMIKELRRTAAIPFSTREYKAGEGIPYVGDKDAAGMIPESGGVGTGRAAYQYDLDDNFSRDTAQKTLDKLLKQRPDLDADRRSEQQAVQKADATLSSASPASSSSKRRSVISPA